MRVNPHGVGSTETLNIPFQPLCCGFFGWPGGIDWLTGYIPSYLTFGVSGHRRPRKPPFQEAFYV